MASGVLAAVNKPMKSLRKAECMCFLTEGKDCYRYFITFTWILWLIFKEVAITVGSGPWKSV